MADIQGTGISPDLREKQLEYTQDDKTKSGGPSALELESLGSLRTVEVSLSAEQVIKNEEYDRKE